MSRRSVHIGVIHVHKLFRLDVDDNISPLNMEKLDIVKSLQNPVRINILQTINVILINKEGHIYAELVSVIEMILSMIHRNYIDFGGVLLMCTIHHIKILTSSW